MLWAAFYPDLLPELPGAPLPLVDHWLRNTAIEFCERTKAHVVTLDLLNAVAEQMEYTPTYPTETGLVEIRAVWFSGDKLKEKSPADLERDYGDWKAETGQPAAYTQERLDRLLLVPAPSAAATSAIKISAALKPSEAATGITDWLGVKYRQTLVAGVKAKMMAMADEPWTKPDRVQLYASQYESDIMDATAAARAGFTQARPRFSGSFC